MKTFRFLHILLILCIVTLASAQDPDTSEVYYTYELIPVEAISDTDTSYQAFILIDSLELKKYEKLVILNEDQEKVLTIKSKDLEKEKDFSVQGSNYRVDVDQWLDISGWVVFGEKADKSKKYFKKFENKIKQNVIHTPIPVNMSLQIDTTLVNNK